MKRILAVLLAAVLIVSLAACGEKQKEDETANLTYEVAMITDVGTMEDHSFNQAAWQGVTAFGSEYGVAHKYYRPVESTTQANLDAIKMAIDAKAKVIVATGYAFEEAVYQAQSEYPKVKFIMVDGQPREKEGAEAKLAENTVAVDFAEEQSGYLAGYAAVTEGYKKLGFIGGKQEPPVIRFGYGFLQGAEAAAEKENISGIKVNYHYTGSFEASPDAEKLAESWYQKGTEIIFACGGSMGASVMTAAEQAKGQVIGVDMDQSKESDTVVTSASKSIQNAVTEMLKKYGDDQFPGGKTIHMDAANNGVELPMEASRFKRFTEENYDEVFKQLQTGAVKVKKDVVKTPEKLGLKRVQVRVAD